MILVAVLSVLNIVLLLCVSALVFSLAQTACVARQKEPEMENQVAALVVSGRVEDRQKLARILDSLSTNVFIVGTLAHAREVLQLQPITIIFCDERLSDGPYRELVAFAKDQRNTAQFFVMLTTGEWPEFLEALGLGVDAIRYPVQPTDVELALIHAMRSVSVAKRPRPFAASA
jgi:DNA-binding NtrC family response regulator